MTLLLLLGAAWFFYGEGQYALTMVCIGGVALIGAVQTFLGDD